MDRMDQLLTALIEAEAHVVRQQHSGKHEQDRADADDWLAQWNPLVKWVREQPRQNVLPRRAQFETPKPKYEKNGIPSD